MWNKYLINLDKAQAFCSAHSRRESVQDGLKQALASLCAVEQRLALAEALS